MDNTSVHPQVGTGKAHSKARPSAAKISRRNRKQMEMSRTKMDNKIPDIQEITLDEFMAAREALEAQAQDDERLQGETLTERKSTKAHERRHISPKSELLGDQGYRSVAKAAIVRAHRMITSGPRNMSGKGFHTGLASRGGPRKLQPRPNAEPVPFPPITPAVSIDRIMTKSSGPGVPAFNWPNIVSLVPDHLQPIRPLSVVSGSKTNQNTQLPLTTIHKERPNIPQVPITVSSVDKVTLPPFLVMARHGQKYAMGQATLPSIATLGLDLRPLARSKAIPQANSMPTRPLPTDCPSQVKLTGLGNDAFANGPPLECITHVSFGSTQTLPAIIVNRDLSEPTKIRVHIQPERLGMNGPSSALRI